MLAFLLLLELSEFVSAETSGIKTYPMTRMNAQKLKTKMDKYVTKWNKKEKPLLVLSELERVDSKTWKTTISYINSNDEKKIGVIRLHMNPNIDWVHNMDVVLEPSEATGDNFELISDLIFSSSGMTSRELKIAETDSSEAPKKLSKQGFCYSHSAMMFAFFFKDENSITFFEAPLQ